MTSLHCCVCVSGIRHKSNVMAKLCWTYHFIVNFLQCYTSHNNLTWWQYQTTKFFWGKIKPVFLSDISIYSCEYKTITVDNRNSLYSKPHLCQISWREHQSEISKNPIIWGELDIALEAIVKISTRSRNRAGTPVVCDIAGQRLYRVGSFLCT